MEVTEVKGIGPATAIKLKTAGINSVADLVSKSIDELIEAGIKKGTATKILANAQEAVGTSVETKPKKEVKAKKPKAKPKAKAEVKKEVKAKKPKAEAKKEKAKPEGLSVGKVKGVGPKTRKLLEDAGIETAEALIETDLAKIQALGITKVTANKIFNNALEALGKDLPVDEKKATPKAAKKKGAKFVEEHQRSPMPQGIPDRKKRGVQIRSTEEDVAISEKVTKAEGWGVQAKELSSDQIERRKRRQEELARRRTISREIPVTPQPIKAVKTKKAKTTPEKPVKVERKKKKSVRTPKKEKVVVDYYTQKDLYPPGTAPKRRGVVGKSGEKKPRIVLERDTYLGKINSHRRSMRVIHTKQVIMKLENGFNPDQIVGKKVYFIYPDNEMKMAGSIAKRFGKASSGKVLINFKRGIRIAGINQKVFTK